MNQARQEENITRYDSSTHQCVNPSSHQLRVNWWVTSAVSGISRLVPEQLYMRFDQEKLILEVCVLFLSHSTKTIDMTKAEPEMPVHPHLRLAGLLTPLMTAITPKFLIHQLRKNHHVYAGNYDNHDRAKCRQKGVRSVMLAEVGRNGHDLARTSLYNNDCLVTFPPDPVCQHFIV